MSNLIKKFNVTINGDSETYEVGADAKNVQFSDEATSPFTNETVEDNVPVGIVEKAENRIYGNAYIKHNNIDIEGRPDDFGPTDDIQEDRTSIEGAGAMSITYGFNSLARGHHSTAIGFDCEAKGWASHAEGWKTTTGQGTNYSHAEGAKTEANHNAAHAEGDAAKAYGYGSHAEGRGTYVYGVGSHVEGMASNIGFADKIAYQNSNELHHYTYDETSEQNKSNNDVDVELSNPKQIINGQLSHAEGLDHTIYGSCCHAEGIGNTINSVYASTAMGEGNQINSNASVAMGYNNTLKAGSNNSLILGNHNDNPGYPNALFLGQYCGVGTGEAQAPALVIGSGDETTASNLMTITHPQTGVASSNNRGDLWGESLNAHFGNNHWKTIVYQPYTDSSTDFVTWYNNYYDETKNAQKMNVILYINQFLREIKVVLGILPNGWVSSPSNNWNWMMLSGLSNTGVTYPITDYANTDDFTNLERQNIENIIRTKLKQSSQTATYVGEGSDFPIYACKLDLAKLFSTSANTYNSIRVRCLGSGPSSQGFTNTTKPVFHFSFVYED